MIKLICNDIWHMQWFEITHIYYLKEVDMESLSPLLCYTCGGNHFFICSLGPSCKLIQVAVSRIQLQS